MDITFWNTIAFILIAVFLVMYSLLDGFDLGIGMLLPFMKDREDADRSLALVVPFWDGNEVWLIMTLGLLFGAFPVAFAAVLSAFFLPLLLANVSLIGRAVAMEFSYHEGSGNVWRLLLSVSSFIVSFGGLFITGHLVYGLPVQADGTLVMGPADLFRSFPVLFALCSLPLVVWHGITYAMWKNNGVYARGLAGRLWPLVMASTVILAGLTVWSVPAVLHRPLAITGMALLPAALIASRVFLDKKSVPFTASCAGIAGFWVVVGALVFPEVIPSFGHTGSGVSLAQAAAPLYSVRLLCTASMVMLPVIFLYIRFVYRIFSRQPKKT